jgi:uncharacterized protein
VKVAAKKVAAMADSGRRLRLTVLPDVYAICRLEASAALPAWALGFVGSVGLVSITRTDDELSIVCPEANMPDGALAGIHSSRGWRCLCVAGPLDFALTGVLAALAVPLAEAGVSIFAISTYDTDYLLVSGEKLADALRALTAAGHQIEQTEKR